MKKFLTLYFTLFLVTTAFSATRTWVGGTTGTWETASNWSGGVAPAANDDVIISTTTTITMTNALLPSSPSGFNSLQITGSGTVVTFVYGSTTSRAINLNASATGGLTIGTGAKVVILGTTTDVNGVYTNGRLNIGLTSGVNTIDGTLEIAGSSAQLTIGSSTTLAINGTIRHYASSGNISTSGTINVGATAVLEWYRNGGSVPSANWNAAATIRYFGAHSYAGTPVPAGTTAGLTYGGLSPYNWPNFEIDVPNSTGTLNISIPSNMVIRGNFNVKRCTGATLRLASTLTNLVVQGNFSVASGVTVNLTNSSTSSSFSTGTLSGGNLTVNGDVDIQGTVDMQATSNGSCDVVAKGNVTVGGKIFSGAATPGLMNLYMFNGSSAGKNLSIANTDLDNVRLTVISNSTVNLASNVGTLRGVRLLTGSNKILLNNFNLTVRGESPTPTNTGVTGGSTNFIVTNGTGFLKMTGVPNDFAGRNFPIASTDGTNFYYNPVSIVPTTAATNFSAKVKRSLTNPGAIPSQLVNLEWDVTPDGAATADLTFTADAAALANFVEQEVILAHYNGSAWDEISTNVSWTNPTISVTGYSAFSPFAIGNRRAFIGSKTLYSKASGNWESASSWSTTIDGTGAGFQPYTGDALVVQKGHNLTLNAPFTAQNLTMNFGRIILGNFNLNLPSLPTITGFANFVTNGTGNLNVNGIGTTPVFIPVGASVAGGVSAIFINSNSGTNGYSFKVSDNPLASTALQRSDVVERIWTIGSLGVVPSQSSAPSISTANIRFQWLSSQANAAFNAAAPISVFSSTNGINWSQLQTSSVTSKTSASGIENFGVFPSQFIVANGGLSFGSNGTRTKAGIGFNVYPSPLREMGNVDFNSDEEQVINIVVSDVLGRVLSQKQELVFKGQNTIPLSMSALTAGHYVITVKSHAGISSKIIVKE